MQVQYTKDEEQDELEMQQWVEKVSAWKLKPLSKFEGTCSKCGKRIVYELGIEQAIQALQNAGWQLRDDGPWCANCYEVL